MNPEDFYRMIAASERRYAELAALVRQIPHPEAHALMARHAGENGMADWYAKWMEPQAQPHQQVLACTED